MDRSGRRVDAALTGNVVGKGRDRLSPSTLDGSVSLLQVGRHIQAVTLRN